MGELTLSLPSFLSRIFPYHDAIPAPLYDGKPLSILDSYESKPLNLLQTLVVGRFYRLVYRCYFNLGLRDWEFLIVAIRSARSQWLVQFQYKSYLKLLEPGTSDSVISR